MPNNNGRVTLAVLSTKIEQCLDEMQRHNALMQKHFEDDKITTIDVDRLKQQAISRNKHFYIIYAAILGLLGSVLATAVLGLW